MCRSISDRCTCRVCWDEEYCGLEDTRTTCPESLAVGKSACILFFSFRFFIYVPTLVGMTWLHLLVERRARREPRHGCGGTANQHQALGHGCFPVHHGHDLRLVQLSEAYVHRDCIFGVETASTEVPGRVSDDIADAIVGFKMMAMGDGKVGRISRMSPRVAEGSNSPLG